MGLPDREQPTRCGLPAQAKGQALRQRAGRCAYDIERVGEQGERYAADERRRFGYWHRCPMRPRSVRHRVAKTDRP